MDAVNVLMPTAEVRFNNLCADALVNVGSAGMPTFVNFFRESIVDVLSAMKARPIPNQPCPILNPLCVISRSHLAASSH